MAHKIERTRLKRFSILYLFEAIHSQIFIRISIESLVFRVKNCSKNCSKNSMESVIICIIKTKNKKTFFQLRKNIWVKLKKKNPLHQGKEFGRVSAGHLLNIFQISKFSEYLHSKIVVQTNPCFIYIVHQVDVSILDKQLNKVFITIVKHKYPFAFLLHFRS